MKKIVKLIGASAASVLLCGCITDKEPEGANLKPGDRLPSFTITMSTGTELTSESLNGKESMIVFFNTECGDCRKELPVVQKFYDLYGNKVEVVCISREEKEPEVEEYWRENGLTLPYSAQADRAIYNLFATTSIPRIYTIDKNLVITNVYTDNPMATLEQLEDDFGL